MNYETLKALFDKYVREDYIYTENIIRVIKVYKDKKIDLITGLPYRDALIPGQTVAAKTAGTPSNHLRFTTLEWKEPDKILICASYLSYYDKQYSTYHRQLVELVAFDVQNKSITSCYSSTSVMENNAEISKRKDWKNWMWDCHYKVLLSDEDKARICSKLFDEHKILSSLPMASGYPASWRWADVNILADVFLSHRVGRALPKALQKYEEVLTVSRDLGEDPYSWHAFKTEYGPLLVGVDKWAKTKTYKLLFAADKAIAVSEVGGALKVLRNKNEYEGAGLTFTASKEMLEVFKGTKYEKIIAKPWMMEIHNPLRVLLSADMFAIEHLMDTEPYFKHIYVKGFKNNYVPTKLEDVFGPTKSKTSFFESLGINKMQWSMYLQFIKLCCNKVEEVFAAHGVQTLDIGYSLFTSRIREAFFDWNSKKAEIEWLKIPFQAIRGLKEILGQDSIAHLDNKSFQIYLDMIYKTMYFRPGVNSPVSWNRRLPCIEGFPYWWGSNATEKLVNWGRTLKEHCSLFPAMQHASEHWLNANTLIYASNIVDTCIDYYRLVDTIKLLNPEFEYLTKFKDVPEINREHDRLVAIVNASKDKLSEAQFDSLKRKWNKWLYEDEEFQIVAPNKASDVRIEGQNLGHCVGTYVNRITSGQTNILFLRKKKDPNASFYTIEVSNDGYIVQVHGKGNRWPATNPEVIPFLDAWVKEKKLANWGSIRNVNSMHYGRV